MSGRSEKQQRRLMKAVEFTQQLLADLTDSSLIGVDLEGRDVVRVAAMPKTAIYHSQGLAFISRRKKGALLSVSSERVVLVWKKSMPDGSTVWSGPIFLKGKSWGAGFTVGFLNMRLCLALMNSKGLDSVLCPHHATAFNASFFVDMNGSKVRPIRTSSAGASTQVQTDAQGGMHARYYLLEACIVDISANGGYFGADMAMNQAIYGPGVDVHDVLECRVAPPPEFQPVYTLLNEYTKAVKREHRTLGPVHDRSMRGSRAAEAAAAAAVAHVAKEKAAAAAGSEAGEVGHSCSREVLTQPAAAMATVPDATEAVLAGAAAKLGARQLSPVRVNLGQ